MNVTRSLLDDIKTKQLQWYGRVQRMEEGRVPKEVMKWRPPGRRKRGRPKLSWAEGIRGLMGEKGLTLRRLMSYIYIYMEHPFLMFLDHTQRRSTVGRTPLDE